MSKARELLRRVISTYSDYGINTLYGEINELLAQPEQEPVAWMYDTYEEGYREKYDCLTTIEDYISNTGVTNVRPLYTSPPKREPLNNVEIMTIAEEHTWDLKRFARAIEKAHGIGDDNE